MAARRRGRSARGDGHRHRRLRHEQRRRDRRWPNGAASTSSSRTTTGSRPCCRRPSRSSTRTAPDSTYPDRRLAGSGVAFKIAQLLLARLPGGPAAALELADLATIGTVADVAPIVGENRAIARLGLERLRTSPRPGIAALLERARVAPADVDLETIAFAHRAAAQRRRTGGGGPRGRPPAARRGSGRGRGTRRRARGRQP